MTKAVPKKIIAGGRRELISSLTHFNKIIGGKND